MCRKVEYIKLNKLVLKYWIFLIFKRELKLEMFLYVFEIVVI